MNIQKMLKQAQAMQGKIQDVQTKLEAEEYDGASGGGAVTARINGKGYAVRIGMDDSLVKVEEKDMLEDLVVAAFNDARAKMEAAFSDAMNGVTEGMNMPPGMKLPF